MRSRLIVWRLSGTARVGITSNDMMKISLGHDIIAKQTRSSPGKHERVIQYVSFDVFRGGGRSMMRLSSA